jgi:hypothetical protein
MSAKGRPERELLPLGGKARSAKGAPAGAAGPSQGARPLRAEGASEAREAASLGEVTR